LEKYDVWSVSIASLLLACKVEEDVRRIREIILVFIHVYRRMRLGLGSSRIGAKQNKGFVPIAQADILNEKMLSDEEKQNILRYVRPLPQYGMLYKEWEEQVMEMENIILRELGFVLSWIPDSHPHNFLLYFIKVLGVEGKDVAQSAWNYCNDALRLDVCVRYSPECIACAAIHLACCECDVSLPLTPTPWWCAFLKEGKDNDLSIICNAILALGDTNCVEGYADACTRYVVSLVDGGSFCDPGSFIWNSMD
jgi:transcription initiation factor TFIIIB Brf1 subunit/transcription initiation factor TFIIB